MVAIPLFTALEIVGNPCDLCLVCKKPKDQWWLCFMRGPRHNYKLMLDGYLPVEQFPEQTDALLCMREHLLFALAAQAIFLQRVAEDQLQAINGQGLDTSGRIEALQQLVLPFDEQMAADGCLTLAQIDCIIKDLEETGECDTSKWPVEAAAVPTEGD